MAPVDEPRWKDPVCASGAYAEPRYLPAGDRALSVELGDAISVELNRRVLQFDFHLRSARVPGILETAPSYRSLLVCYDPLVIEYEALVERLRRIEAGIASGTPPPRRLVEIPCCYDPDLGFDLEAVRGRHGLSSEELVRLHSSPDYMTYFIGFSPGHPYLGGVPPEIATPRLATPRARTPAGSVGIGGSQCCVYSVEAPGGYWILGRTPLRLYDPSAPEPILLRPGDQVRFQPITRAEYEQIRIRVQEGAFRPEISYG